MFLFSVTLFFLGKVDTIVQNDIYTWLEMVSRNERKIDHLLPPIHIFHFFPFYGWITNSLAKRAHVDSYWSARWTQTGQPLEEDMTDGRSLPLHPPPSSFLKNISCPFSGKLS